MQYLAYFLGLYFAIGVVLDCFLLGATAFAGVNYSTNAEAFLKAVKQACFRSLCSVSAHEAWSSFSQCPGSPYCPVVEAIFAVYLTCQHSPTRLKSTQCRATTPSSVWLGVLGEYLACLFWAVL